ncbi:hypothetical protein [Sulfurimonas autotrophica]|uniref:Uncharacterized protein n=1 Tax=Sulfurimonas autotrophica (strain ATCC BAA-671 / DSM 16294 / JCM 11897 / OK10) TaxID=563040 RepID=E0UPK1_SULAO|nr:hypothetical protein [Sulfurimonas autotrophica]ADN08593.1 conserved hypothetical protein [Sulfurimonas autotrophica DSM 16294]
MLSTILESLYLKVLVNIVVQRESTLVHIELCSKKGIVDEVSTEFNTTLLNNQMYDFISEYIKESPYFYISILDTSIVQGAIPTCEKNKLSYYYDLSMSEYKCFDNKWNFYTAKNDIHQIEREYEDIGIDMIFSPFVILANFFQDKINNNLAMYALVQDGFISVAVFENSQLLYAEHLDMLTGDENEDILLNENIEEDLDLDSGIDLEDIDVDEGDINSLDEFGDIEDLDSLEDIDEFSDNKDVEEELYESDKILPEDEENEAFNEDYQRFSLMQSAVANFYRDDKYESRFIENVYIADCAGVTNDLKKYLEEEMFFNVYVRRADLGVEVCELAKMELGL